MTEPQLEHFRRKLLAWREDILRESMETIHRLQQENLQHPDFIDRAAAAADQLVEMQARNRQRKLIAKIDAALQRIQDGTYGYCEETGEPISIERLEARPTATLSFEARERHERSQKLYRTDD